MLQIATKQKCSTNPTSTGNQQSCNKLELRLCLDAAPQVQNLLELSEMFIPIQTSFELQKIRNKSLQACSREEKNKLKEVLH